MTRFKTALSPADRPSQEEMLSITGLEFVQKMLRGDDPRAQGRGLEDGRLCATGATTCLILQLR